MTKVNDFINNEVYASDAMLGTYKMVDGIFFRKFIDEWEHCPLTSVVLQCDFIRINPTVDHEFKLTSAIDDHVIYVSVRADSISHARSYLDGVNKEYLIRD